MQRGLQHERIRAAVPCIYEAGLCGAMLSKMTTKGQVVFYAGWDFLCSEESNGYFLHQRF